MQLSANYLPRFCGKSMEKIHAFVEKARKKSMLLWKKHGKKSVLLLKLSPTILWKKHGKTHAFVEMLTFDWFKTF